jgi:subtilisin family serine protease
LKTVLYQVNLGVADNCANYLIKHLVSKGVSRSQIQIRTNENHAGYTQFCSIAVKGHKNELFGIPNVQLHAVNPIERINTDVEPSAGKVTAETTEAIHKLTGVKEARNQLGLTGKGIKVGVIDSGVYYLHPALGGGFGAGFKVESGYDFVGDAFGSNDNTTPKADNDPIDNCSEVSHGTHVAGIIGANAVDRTESGFVPAVPFTGAAPDVQLGAYRVFGCSGSTGSDIMSAAILRAAAEGCHIINLSIGGSPAYSESSHSVVAAEVGKKGHFVFASNGNSGASGAFAGSAPANSRGGFGVGSADNIEKPTAYADVEGNVYAVGFGQASPAFPPAFDLSNIVANNIDADQNDVNDDGTLPTCNPAVKGFPALIRWGNIGGSGGRCNQAAKCGATACILYSNTDMMVGIAGGSTIPSLFIARKAGQDIIAAIKAGKKPSAVVHMELKINMSVATAGTISDFSSGGLDMDLFIKPDIVGVGGEVFSTLSPFAAKAAKEASAYGLMSGTSMASPNAAGIVALYLQHQYAIGKTVSFDEVRTKMQNGAVPMKMYKSDLLESVVKQGAGLINVYNSILHQTRVSPSSLSLNDTVRTLKSYDIEISNDASAAAKYDLTTIGAAFIEPFTSDDDATQLWERTKVSENGATVSFSETSFTVPSGSSKKVTVTITAPSTNARWPIFSGYLVIRNDQDETPVHVPYAGVIGDWNEAPIYARISPTFNAPIGNVANIPNLGSTGLYDKSYKPIQKIANATEGIVVMHIAATTSRKSELKIDYLGSDVAKFEALGLDVQNLTPYLAGGNRQIIGGVSSRNTPGVFQSVSQAQVFSWTGLVVNAAFDDLVQLPAGSYRFNFYGLKHFGTTSNGGMILGTDRSSFDIVSKEITLVYNSLPPVETTTTVPVTSTTEPITATEPATTETSTEPVTTSTETTTEPVTTETTTEPITATEPATTETSTEPVTSTATTTEDCTTTTTTTEEACVGYNCPKVTTTEVIAVTTEEPLTTVDVTTTYTDTVEPGTTVVDITTDEVTVTDGPIISGARSVAVSSAAFMIALFAF